MDAGNQWPGYGCRITYEDNVGSCAQFPTGKQNYFALAKILPEFLTEILGYKVTFDSLMDDDAKVEMYKIKGIRSETNG
jgi:hypothetical protein